MDPPRNVHQPGAAPAGQASGHLPSTSAHQVMVSQSQNIQSNQQTQNVVIDSSMMQNIIMDQSEHSKVVLVTVPEGISAGGDGDVEIIVTTHHLTSADENPIYEIQNSEAQYQQLENVNNSNIDMQQVVYDYNAPVMTSDAGSVHVESSNQLNSANAIYDSALSSGIIPASQPNTVICSSSVSASDIVSALTAANASEQNCVNTAVTSEHLTTAFDSVKQSPTQSLIRLSRFPTGFHENQTSMVEAVQLQVEPVHNTVTPHTQVQTTVGAGGARSVSSMAPEEQALYEKQETMKSLELVEAQWKSSVSSAMSRSPPRSDVFPPEEGQVKSEGDSGMFLFKVVDIEVDSESEKPAASSSTPAPASASVGSSSEVTGQSSYSKDGRTEGSVTRLVGFKCTICETQFSDIDELNVHVNSHQNFKCSKCDLMFVSATSLQKHETIHSELSGLKCDDCGKTFGSKSYLKSHVKTHLGGKAFNCDICNLSFMSSKALTGHKVTHNNSGRQFCDICNKAFSSTFLLEQHVLGKHTKNTGSGQKGTRNKAAKKTTKTTLSQVKVKTPLVASRPVTRGVTRKEAKKVDSKKASNFSCMICKEKFATKILLKKHARIHLGQRILRCDKCGKVFQDSIKMKMHKLTHSGQSYYCEFCGKIFNYANTLALHKKSHENEKGFKCKTCKKRFATAEMLKSHKTVHATPKTYICDICEKAFTSQYYLKTHKRLHTGEKHYGCLQCGESFMFSNGLRRHVMKVHNAQADTSGPGTSFVLTSENHAENEDIDDPGYELFDAEEDDSNFDSTKLKFSIEYKDMIQPARDEDGVFECRLCQKKFQSMPAANNHMKEHVDFPFTCKICKKTFSCNLYLQKHLKRHDDKQSFECSICKKSFRSAGYLNQHVKIHTGEKSYQCQLCGEEFIFANSLRRHLRSHQDLGPNIQGLVRKKRKGKNYRPVSEFNPETISHLTCNLCGLSFKTVSQLNEHMKSHTGEHPVYECSVCKKEFSSHRALLKHKQGHVDDKPISCEICHKTFRASYYLKSHMNLHNGHKPYKCKHCDESFTYASTRRRHMRIHIPEESMNHMCSVCGKKFFEQGECERHMLGHTNEKPFMCDICGKTFASKALLRSHMKRHNGERQYKCDLCEKTFLYRYRLQRHVKTHMGIKSYKCNSCGKAFLTQAYLSTHLRSHTGEKPYKCEVCGEEFSFSNTFRRHKRIHNGLTLNCEVCGKMCLEPFDLKRHMQSHCGQKTVLCDFCGKSFSHQGSRKRHIRRTHPEMIMPFQVPEDINMPVQVS